MEIRRSYDRLISTMGFPILVRRHLYIESRSWSLVLLPWVSSIVEMCSRFCHSFYVLSHLLPSAAYTSMRQWTGSALVHVTTCRLFGAKPLPEPTLTYCQLDSWELIRSFSFKGGWVGVRWVGGWLGGWVGWGSRILHVSFTLPNKVSGPKQFSTFSFSFVYHSGTQAT